MQVITRKDLLKTISYNPDTGLFLWNSRSGGTRGDNVFNALYAGKHAGNIVKVSRSKTSYMTIKVFGVTYKSHRLAFILMGCDLPEQVDHINHNGLDNRWENLRASNSSDNSKNLPIQKSNKTGVVGVNWHKSARKWQARAVDNNGKRIDLGRYDDFDRAVSVRKEYEIKFNYYEHRGSL